jgi:hypothetical protein
LGAIAAALSALALAGCSTISVEIPASSFVHYAAGPDREETVIYVPATSATVTVTLSARVMVVSVPDSRIRRTAVVRGLDDYPPRDAAGERQDALLE